jgi:hypothetical protein
MTHEEWVEEVKPFLLKKGFKIFRFEQEDE